MSTSQLAALADGWLTSVGIFACGYTLALALGLLICLGLLARARPLRWAARLYVEFFRGTSLVVQIFWMYFVLPLFGVAIDPVTTVILALMLNTAAYGAEVFRAGIQAVDRGQREAARSLGLGPLRTLVLVVLPQALILILRPLSNLAIETLKATAIVSLVSVADMTYRAYQIYTLTNSSFGPMAIVLAAYYVTGKALQGVFRRLEVRATPPLRAVRYV